MGPPPFIITARGWLGPTVVATLAAAVYAPSLAFGFTDLDDRDLVVDDAAFLSNPWSLLRAFGRAYMHAIDPAHPYYRPIVTASYALDAQWNGIRPFGYHLTNVLAHAAASAMVLLLLRRMGIGGLVGGLAAIAFAVHPALAGAVAWVPGRNDSLLAVSFLGAWLAFLSHARRPCARAFLAHLVLFVLALGTKETAIALPLVCVATGLLDPERPVRWRSWLIGWAACLALRALPAACLPSAARALAASLSPADAARGVLLLPAAFAQLVLPYDPSLLSAADDAPVLLGLCAAAVVAFVAMRSRAVRRPVVALGVAVFVSTAMPAFVLAGTLMLSSRLYLPAVGVCLALAEIARALAPAPRAVVAYGAAVGIGLAALTLGTERNFRDPLAFARASVDSAPRSALAHECLGAAFQRRHAFAAARAEYLTAVSLGAQPVVHNNLAALDMADGRWRDADRELRAALAVDPGSATAQRNLAIVVAREVDGGVP